MLLTQIDIKSKRLIKEDTILFTFVLRLSKIFIQKAY